MNLTLVIPVFFCLTGISNIDNNLFFEYLNKVSNELVFHSNKSNELLMINNYYLYFCQILLLSYYIKRRPAFASLFLD